MAGAFIGRRLAALASVASLASLASLVGLVGLVGLVTLAGCGGGGSANTDEALPAVGRIPGAEFAKVPPPTFQQVIVAYQTVTTANPALLNDEAALSRALFDEVRRITGGTAVAAKAAAGEGHTLAVIRPLALFDLESRLTLAEWKLIITSPLNSARVAPTIQLSAQAAVDQLPCDADVDFADGKADALRHAYWNALMTRRVSAAFAEQFATAHETGSSNTAAASAMDLHNNAAGRALATRYAAASDAELLQLLAQYSFTLVPAGAAIPAAWPGLVTLSERARRAFDARFTGTLTQPDAGAGAWALELDLAQCGAVVRGNYRATRGGVTIERRFAGTLAGTAPITVSLVVADPLAFEPAAAQAPCLGMQVALAGTETALSGTWLASNCPQGGTMELRR
jgi:hypothetical protein